MNDRHPVSLGDDSRVFYGRHIGALWAVRKGGVLWVPPRSKSRAHGRFSRDSLRCPEIERLSGGARGIRNGGVTRSLAEGKRAQVLEKLRVDVRQHPRENEFAYSSGRVPSYRLEFRCRENAFRVRNLRPTNAGLRRSFDRTVGSQAAR